MALIKLDVLQHWLYQLNSVGSVGVLCLDICNGVKSLGGLPNT